MFGARPHGVHGEDRLDAPAMPGAGRRHRRPARRRKRSQPPSTSGRRELRPPLDVGRRRQMCRDHCSDCVVFCHGHIPPPSSAAIRGLSVRIRNVSGRVRYAGLRNPVRVTDGHEAEAKAAQLRKRPNRIGLFILRALGFRGQVGRSAGVGGHLEPSRQHHAARRERSARCK